MLRDYYIFHSSETIQQVIYFHIAPGQVEQTARGLWNVLQEELDRTHTALVFLEVTDWNGDLSPWQLPGVLKKGEDFAGNAPVYLNQLCQCIIPELEESLPIETTVRRMIGGYSMGGLFALYAGSQTEYFQDVISVSGSLWFDGWEEYLQNGAMSKSVERVYLSLGDREKKTGNPRMARVEDATEATKYILQHAGIHVRYERNPGGHFQDGQERIARGIRAMLSFDWFHEKKLK